MRNICYCVQFTCTRGSDSSDSHDPNTMIVWWRATKIHWLKKYHEIVYHVDWRGSLHWKVQEAIVGTTRFGQKAIKRIHARFPFSVCFEVKVECLFLQGLSEIGDKWVKCNSRSCSILQMGLNQLQPAWPHLFKLVSGRCYSVQITSSHNDPQLHWSRLLCTDQNRQIHVRPLTNPCNNFDKSM